MPIGWEPSHHETGDLHTFLCGWDTFINACAACMVSAQPRWIAEAGIEPSSFYGTPRVSRPSDAAGRSWLPGEVLPTRCECINNVNQLKEKIHELITCMQTNILNEMNEVQQFLQLRYQKRSGIYMYLRKIYRA